MDKNEYEISLRAILERVILEAQRDRRDRVMQLISQEVDTIERRVLEGELSPSDAEPLLYVYGVCAGFVCREA